MYAENICGGDVSTIYCKDARELDICGFLDQSFILLGLEKISDKDVMLKPSLIQHKTASEQPSEPT